MNTLNYNHLYYFYIIAKKGSMVEASRFLNVTKPTLSSQLKILEETLKMKLFKRTGRTLVLTPKGAQVFSHADKMFKISENMLKGMVKTKKQNKDQVRIGITSMVSKSFTFKALLSLFKSRNFSPYIIESSFEFLLKELRSKKIDIILSEALLNQSSIEGVQSTSLGSNEYVFVTSKKHKGKIKGFPKGIEDLPFFSYTLDNNIRWEIEYFFKLNGIELEIIGEADNIEIQKSAILSGICFAALPIWAVEEEVKNGKLIILGHISHYVPHVIASYNVEANQKRLRQVLNLLLQDRADYQQI
ncbi:MAG: LysR family transcriptional regulator [Bdellovibrionales bacterium]|nr:LysR family transcriptional regulator [Bdellovibrionales bacterium]